MQLPPFPLSLSRRVAFSETDAAGLIHFTTYFTFMEAAEADLFRQLELKLLWEEDGRKFGFPRVDCQCRFRRPVGFDDAVGIELRISEIEESRIHYTFLFTDPEGKRCATGSMVTACALRESDGTLRSAALPEVCRDRLQSWKNQAD